MVARTYYGLGPREVAIDKFNSLSPHVVDMLEMQAECLPLGPDYMAVGIALDGLDTAAFHFTRRRDFYFQLERPPYRDGNGRMKSAEGAAEAFKSLAPYSNALRLMQSGCRPFGGDYMALAIAMEALGTAAFHFTRDATFYGSKFDSSGPLSGTPR